MNVYILRAKPHGNVAETEFLEGRISIGWPCGVSFLGFDRAQITDALNAYANSHGEDNVSEVVISLVEQFVHMPKDSIVISPSIKDKDFVHLFKTTGEYEYDSSRDNEDSGNPHFIQVAFLKSVPRVSLPSDVLKSLSGARKTLSKISQHFQVMSDFIESGSATSVPEVALSDRDLKARTTAKYALYALLESEDESIRLQASIAILNLDK